MKTRTDTSWHKVGKWNNSYFEDHLIGPGVVRLLALKQGDSLLDLGCGSKWLAKKIPKEVQYFGLDLVYGQDATKPFSLDKTFSHAAIILALQNMETPAGAIQNAAVHLKENGKLVIVLNHPAFRIPRQSSWGIDENSKLQYRRENIYMSPLKIPITMHPACPPSLRSGVSGRGLTWSFHHPLSAYTKMLADNGFLIEKLEEWTSDKESVGRAGRMENRSRAEFPLFLAIAAKLASKGEALRS
jgi:SAM-dependent methyltransferase